MSVILLYPRVLRIPFVVHRNDEWEYVHQRKPLVQVPRHLSPPAPLVLPWVPVGRARVTVPPLKGVHPLTLLLRSTLPGYTTTRSSVQGNTSLLRTALSRSRL